MKFKNISFLTAVGVMAALVFVSSRFSFNIPLPVGNTRLHLGNVFCILSGLVLGNIGGGLAAGIGSLFFDLTDPLYIATAPFTLVFKFMLAFVCGTIAYAKNSGALSVKLNAAGAICGSLTYLVLHLTRTFLRSVLFLGTAVPTAVILTLQSGLISLINAVIAVIVAVPLGIVVNKQLANTGLRRKIMGN